MAKVKVGVVGCGVMGKLHAQKAKGIKEAKLVGVYDQDAKAAAEIAESLKVKTFAAFEELLSNVEAVIIATPTSTHYDIAMKALGSLKHAFVEKPLAGDSELGARLAEESENKKMVLAIGMVERFNPAFTKTYALVKNRRILGIDIKRFSPYPDRISDASVVWDMMIHDIDLALALSRSPLETIKAEGKKITSNLLDEATATLYFKDGLIAKISGSRAKNDKLRRLQITTDKHMLDADLLGKKLYSRNLADLTLSEEIALPLQDQITLEQKDFYTAIRSGRAPKCNAGMAIQAMKIAEEIERICSSQL